MFWLNSRKSWKTHKKFPFWHNSNHKQRKSDMDHFMKGTLAHCMYCGNNLGWKNSKLDINWENIWTLGNDFWNCTTLQTHKLLLLNLCLVHSVIYLLGTFIWPIKFLQLYFRHRHHVRLNWPVQFKKWNKNDTILQFFLLN